MIDKTVGNVEEAVANIFDGAAVMIGELVMGGLKQLDDVAYVRFASVYRSFEDIREFVQAIEEFRVHDDGSPH